MELKYFWVIPIVVLVAVVVLLWRGKRIDKVEGQRLIANSGFLKSTRAYKDVIFRYKVCYYTTAILLIVAVTIAAILTARPVSIDQTDDPIYNRDIMLCMDVSGSMSEINNDILETYEKIIDQMKEERFGVTIFDASPQLLVPLTQDYTYIKDTFGLMKKSLEAMAKMYTDDGVSFDSQDGEYFKLLGYLTSGTTIGDGSSKAGNGLASCAYGFSEQEHERSKVIILSTDNEVYGDQIVDVINAAKIAKEQKIKVFVVAPSKAEPDLMAELKSAAELTGGKLYTVGEGDTASRVIGEIETTEKTLLNQGGITTEVDHPEVLFVLLMVIFSIIIILEVVVL